MVRKKTWQPAGTPGAAANKAREGEWFGKTQESKENAEKTKYGEKGVRQGEK